MVLQVDFAVTYIWTQSSKLQTSGPTPTWATSTLEYSYKGLLKTVASFLLLFFLLKTNYVSSNCSHQKIIAILTSQFSFWSNKEMKGLNLQSLIFWSSPPFRNILVRDLFFHGGPEAARCHKAEVYTMVKCLSLCSCSFSLGQFFSFIQSLRTLCLKIRVYPNKIHYCQLIRWHCAFRFIRTYKISSKNIMIHNLLLLW